jgi:RimJ/RimL family protein N-acetyltransferase
MITVAAARTSCDERRRWLQEIVEFSTPRLRLREQTEADHLAANEYESDAEVVRYQSHPVRTPAESLAYIRRVIAEQAETPRRLYDLAIELDGRMVGRVGLSIARSDDGEAALWYVLRRDLWGRGFAVEAARALLDFGFRELALHRVFVDTDPRNAGSIRVAEKLGMRREAHFVENARYQGEWCDSLIFAILEREWTRAS